MEVTLTLRFRVVDPEALDRAADYSEDDPSTIAEKVEAVVANLDLIALARGYPQGWLDVGLERVS